MVSNNQGHLTVDGNLPQVIAESCQLITSVFTQSYQSVSAEEREEIRGDLFHALSVVIADIFIAMKTTDGEYDGQTDFDDFYSGEETDMTDLLRQILKEDK